MTAAAQRLTDILADLRPTIDAALSSACDFGDGSPVELSEAIRYALLAPGKRLRPALVLIAAETCGGRIEDALPAAVAVEMIHAYSLIHDDLPAMDDDDLRRGRATTHIRFGEATAILAGDALQAEAFGHLARRVHDPGVAVGLIGELARASGASGLVGGQSDDLAAESLAIADFPSPRAAREHLESIHRRKTGVLFTACVKMGAISAGADTAAMDALSGFATAFGLAFQITDDVLDFTATDEQLGKRTQKDAERGKFTFPDLMAAEHSESERDVRIEHGIALAGARARELVGQAHQSLALFGESAWRLTTMAEYLLERTS